MIPGREFLLQAGGGSLFELSNGLSDQEFRCKGCDAHPVMRWEREAHYRAHLAEQKRLEARRAEQVRRDRIERLAKARERRRT